MSTVGIEDLQAHAEDLLRRVAESGETIDIVYHGRVAARLVPLRAPIDPAPARPESGEHPNHAATHGGQTEGDKTGLVLDRLWALGDEISTVWPKGVSAVDAIRDVRRDS